MRKILGITMGDPAGVGPEITVKALQDPKVYESCKPLVVGDAAILERACGFVGAKCTIHPVADPSEGLYEHGIIDILDLGLLKPEDFAIGQVSAAAGDAAFRYVRKVIELAMDGNNNASISAIKLKSGALAIIYNDVSFNEDGSRTVWPDQRCPVAMAISEDGGKTWPWRRIAEHGEGFIGPWNDVNNRRYEYPVMMQSKDGKIHAAYAWGRRVRIKYVCVDEAWIRGAKVCKGAEDNPEMPCNR